MRWILVLLAFNISFHTKAQIGPMSFELGDTSHYNYFFIDTISYPNNIWQIGDPQKTVFSSGVLNSDRAIVTDTVNPYPANDTSVLYMKLPAFEDSANMHFLTGISFSYRLDVDSGDRGYLHYSKDNGQNWINALTDSTISLGWEGKRFDTSTSDWQSCIIEFWNFPYGLTYLDTIIFRWTFISDSNASTRDGWILDRFAASYHWEASVNLAKNSNLIAIHPNPSDGHIKLQSKSKTRNASILVYDLNGLKVFETNSMPKDGNLYLHLPDGMYILKYADEKDIAVKRLLIQH